MKTQTDDALRAALGDGAVTDRAGCDPADLRRHRRYPMLRYGRRSARSLRKEMPANIAEQTKTAVALCHGRLCLFLSSFKRGFYHNWRKRRGLVERLRYLPPSALIIATPPEHTPVGKSGRSAYQQPRRSKLSSEQIEAINRKSQLTLRELAAECGVSHETIRAARRTADVGEESGSERRGNLSSDL